MRWPPSEDKTMGAEAPPQEQWGGNIAANQPCDPGNCGQYCSRFCLGKKVSLVRQNQHFQSRSDDRITKFRSISYETGVQVSRDLHKQWDCTWIEHLLSLLRLPLSCQLSVRHCYPQIAHSLVVVIFMLILSGCVTALPDFSFSDPRQGQFAQNLQDFHISWPSRVSPVGDLITRNPHYKHIPGTRVKRSSDHNSSSPSQGGSWGVEATTGLPIHYQIALQPGKDVTVKITRVSFHLAPSALLERRASRSGNLSDSSFSTLDDYQGCHYTGHILGEAHSRVALSACHGLRGFLQLGNDEYLVEPVKGHNWTEETGQPHLVYRRSAVPNRQDFVDWKKTTGGCGVDENYEEIMQQRELYEMNHRRGEKPGNGSGRKRRSISIEKHVETLVVVDTDMVNYYQNEDIETYVLTIMNMVASLFHDASVGNAVNIVIVRLIIMQEPDDELQVTHHADKTLKSFCKWQKNVNFRDDDHPNHHDVAVLLTRRNICSRNNEPCSTLGLSQVSGLCQPHRTCNINEDTGLSLAWTVAHEIGHNFGMKHDNQHSDCMSDPDSSHIMAPHLVWDKIPSTWSNCSRTYMTKFLDRNWGYCLDDPPGQHDFLYPELPAGTMYDADHQCRLLYGEGAERCTGIEALENICTTLWCRVNNKCSTKLQPAAVGTICGVDKWCFAGRCVDINERPQAIDGQWGQWEEWTACTRTCGAGVSLSERHCNHPPPSNGGKYCTGERKRYRICNTDDCPDDGVTFRAKQCAEFNDLPYKGATYEWEPLTTPDTPCQLHCKPKNLFFSVLLKDLATDGTPCVVGSRHMCISGRCRHVGCDWVIDSNAVEDRCGVCFGDGSTCKTVKQQFNETTKNGYVEATVIPAGARNIRVEEVAEANNFLALRNEAGEYYLNGHWFIQWSGDYELAGTVIHYKRIGNREKFVAPGPLKEPLHIMLLMQSHNPGVEFEYTVPNENANSSKKQEFRWDYIGWSHCTVSCGGGSQRSAVICKEQEAGPVDDQYCELMIKPDDQLRPCNVHLCPARWWTGPWQHCTASCGNDGMHKRTVICVRSLGSDEQIALEDQACEGLKKPVELEPCHPKEPCPRRGVWEVKSWSNCTRPCNGGVQYRKVTCVAGDSCDESMKPDIKQPCNTHRCSSDLVEDLLSIEEGSLLMNDVLGSDINNLSLGLPKSVTNSQTVPETLGDKNIMINDSQIEKNESSFSWKLGPFKTGAGGYKNESRESFLNMIAKAAVENKYNRLNREKFPDSVGQGMGGQNQVLNFTSRLTHLWQTSNWSQCSNVCGQGTRSREVYCADKMTGRKVAVVLCGTTVKPATFETCSEGSCLVWSTGDWAQCLSSCYQYRQVRCLNLTSQQVTDKCPPETKPSNRQNCKGDGCLSEALTSPCESNDISSNICRMLKNGGLCHREHVKAKCCRTCQDHHRPQSESSSISQR